MKTSLAILLLASPALADVPAKCRATVLIDAVTKGDVTGTVSKISGATVTVDKLSFDYQSDLPMPFKQGDTIGVHYRCGGPPPGMYCDARIEDASGKVLVIAAWNGTDDLSAGWTAKPGKILKEDQNPNEKRKSVQRSHELALAHGKTTGTATAACTEITDGDTTWLATGYAITWDGVRPPEGIDRKGYSLVRK